LPVGNCLIGHVPNRDCMALALMHSAGVDQMFGYTAATFFGYMGWGIDYYFSNQRGRYTLSESFFCNNQALVHQLVTRFPANANVNFDSFDYHDIKKLKKVHKISDPQEFGLLWDRDIVAFYGDPAWEVRFPRCKSSWDYSFSQKNNIHSLKIKFNENGKWGKRPLIVFMPAQFQNFEILKGEEFMPVLNKNFILIPFKGTYKKNDEIDVVFKAEPVIRNKTSKDMPPIFADKMISNKKNDKSFQLLKNEIVELVPENYFQGIFSALQNAGDNANELNSAMRTLKDEKLSALCFLIVNMPVRDLRTLTGDYLIDNINFAFEARDKLSWGKLLPKDIFLNYVLPYANITETRDNWRETFFKKLFPLVKNCSSMTEAAETLNQKIWELLDVKYHATKRKKADQSPFESMNSKFASCSGLSILLIDACRAVCVPARFVGIPQWKNKNGNHSWVEVWDKNWLFTGAAEPAPLNSGWFTDDASQADPTNPVHSIYAVTFKKTGLNFPCVWNSNANYVSAHNITERYVDSENSQQKNVVAIQLFDEPNGNRVAESVVIRAKGKIVGKGITRNESNDKNDMLEFKLPANKKFEIEIKRRNQPSLNRTFATTNSTHLELKFFLDEIE